MALTALIAAYHESAEAGALRATLPLAGRTVVERQVRLAVAAGASRVILFVERIPADLTAAIDRLRRDRVPVQLARSVEEAAEAIEPSDRLLLVADGTVADRSQLTRVVKGEGAVVLTVPDGTFGEPYERIDATSRWAGLAAVNGAVLHETAAMLRDWDLQSTLLRRSLQAGAAHVAADGPVAILDSRDDLATLERRIMEAAAQTGEGWSSRLLAPVERMATSVLLDSPIGAPALGTAAAILTGGGALAFLYGWFWAGLILLLLATPLDGIAGRIARVRMQDDIGRSWWSYLLPALSGGALVALAYALAPGFGWGMILLAFTTLAFLVALGIESEGRSLRGSLFLAERKAMVWLMLPFAAAGFWHGGLAALFAYAAGSFFWAQREAHFGTPPRQD